MKERNKLATIIFGLLLLLIIQNKTVYASMELYIQNHCESCHKVMDKGKELIDELIANGELEIVNVTGIKADLPSLPALVDGKTVIIGTGILEYFRSQRKQVP